MDPTTLAAHFDEMTRSHESGHETNGRSQLTLLKEPLRTVPVDLHRRMDRVDPSLVTVFRHLVTGSAPWPLFLYGGVGTGKTLAALALADFVKESRYWTLEDLCSSIMDSDSKTSDTWSRLENYQLAELDELGERVKSGDLLYTTLKKHLDIRERGAGRVGIYISNLTPDQLVNLFDQRIVSRLTAGTVFELTGRDRRKQT